MNDELNSQNTSDSSEENPLEKGFFSSLGIFFLEVIKVIVLAFVTIVLVRSFLFKPFVVEGESMEPTYYAKEYLLIDELSYRLREPQRGEVIVFRAPAVRKEFYLKRIIGLPGEKIKVDNNKVIVINDEYPQGKIVDENYLTENTTGTATILLGPDEYFVMGDNRDASYDSRRFGAIAKDSIVGRTWIRGYPFSRLNMFHPPSYNL